jgi:hypothetical protein
MDFCGPFNIRPLSLNDDNHRGGGSAEDTGRRGVAIRAITP